MCSNIIQSRRGFLTAALGSAICAAIPAPVQAAIRPLPERNLALYNINTGESLNLTYWSQGRHIPQALAEISRLLRDHRTDEVHPIDPRLLDFLSATHRRLGVKGAVHVVSAYRSPVTNAMKAAAEGGVAQGSLHMDGRAVDIRIPGASAKLVGRAARSLHVGGVGTYARSKFVHVDTGTVRYW